MADSKKWSVSVWKVKGGKKHGKLVFVERIGAVTSTWRTPTLAHNAAQVKVIKKACVILNQKGVHGDDDKGLTEVVKQVCEEAREKELKAWERKLNKELKDDPDCMKKIVNQQS